MAAVFSFLFCYFSLGEKKPSLHSRLSRKNSCFYSQKKHSWCFEIKPSFRFTMCRRQTIHQGQDVTSSACLKNNLPPSLPPSVSLSLSLSLKAQIYCSWHILKFQSTAILSSSDQHDFSLKLSHILDHCLTSVFNVTCCTWRAQQKPPFLNMGYPKVLMVQPLSLSLSPPSSPTLAQVNRCKNHSPVLVQMLRFFLAYWNKYNCNVWGF